ncbi:hypothetical protein Hanom_Chr11g01036551 [Helianthus anomalus]
MFPPVVHHWVERAYPPAESDYVEGLNNENLMTATMVDSVSQPRRLAEIQRRWMHDNNELHRARIVIQELKDEKYRLESQLQTAGLRESRFVSKKNKAENDLKRVTTHLAEERIIWARDIAEKDRVRAHAKTVQEELERKAIAEAQKVRSELSTKMVKFRIDTDFGSQVQDRYQTLTDELEASHAKAHAKKSSATHQARLKEAESALEQSNAEVDSLTSQLAGLRRDQNWLITNGLVGAFEYLRQLESFTALLDRLPLQLINQITPAFDTKKGKLQGDMANALEAACNDPLPAYADLVNEMVEDGVDSLRLMLDPADEAGEE